MSAANRDAPEGRQYHVRYRYGRHTGGPYWSAVFTDRADVAAELLYLNGCEDITVEGVFVRDVSPWRPDATP